MRADDDAGVLLNASGVAILGDDERFQGVRIVSADFGGQPSIQFDDLGAPSTGGSVELEYDEQRYRVEVAAFTGRVTVEKVEPGGG